MSFDDMMKQLRIEYIGELPDKINTIVQLNNENDVSALREVFHKLKGTGQTYGIPEISKVGEVLETMCVKYPNEVEAAVPVAVQLLKLIHQQRAQSQSYDVTQDPTFTKIEQIIELKSA